MLRIPHCIDNRLTDGGKVVSLTHRPRSAIQKSYFSTSGTLFDRLCGLVLRVIGYRSGGSGSIPGTTRFSGKKKGKQIVGLERGPLSHVSTTEELLDRKVAAPV
jgi:hypothetical protein